MALVPKPNVAAVVMTPVGKLEKAVF